MPDYLAHVNIGLWKADVDQQRFNQFVAIGTQIGMQSVHHPQLIWQHSTQFYQDPHVIRVFGEPRMALNLSVWQDIASLKAFVYQHAHHAAMKDRDLWFEKLSKPSYALWWVPHDVTPTLKDANPRVDC